MHNQVDRRNKLKERPFSYKQTKGNKILIYWENKQVMILNGKKTDQFLKRLENKDEDQIQLELAKITGNFKRGNERIINSKKN